MDKEALIRDAIEKDTLRVHCIQRGSHAGYDYYSVILYDGEKQIMDPKEVHSMFRRLLPWSRTRAHQVPLGGWQLFKVRMDSPPGFP